MVWVHLLTICIYVAYLTDALVPDVHVFIGRWNCLFVTWLTQTTFNNSASNCSISRGAHNHVGCLLQFLLRPHSDIMLQLRQGSVLIWDASVRNNLDTDHCSSSNSIGAWQNKQLSILHWNTRGWEGLIIHKSVWIYKLWK